MANASKAVEVTLTLSGDEAYALVTLTGFVHDKTKGRIAGQVFDALDNAGIRESDSPFRYRVGVLEDAAS